MFDVSRGGVEPWRLYSLGHASQRQDSPAALSTGNRWHMRNQKCVAELPRSKGGKVSREDFTVGYLTALSEYDDVDVSAMVAQFRKMAVSDAQRRQRSRAEIAASRSPMSSPRDLSAASSIASSRASEVEHPSRITPRTYDVGSAENRQDWASAASTPTSSRGHVEQDAEPSKPKLQPQPLVDPLDQGFERDFEKCWSNTKEVVTRWKERSPRQQRASEAQSVAERAEQLVSKRMEQHMTEGKGDVPEEEQPAEGRGLGTGFMVGVAILLVSGAALALFQQRRLR